MTATELKTIDGSAGWPIQIPMGSLPPGLEVPLLTEDASPVEYAEALGEAYLLFAGRSQRKSAGHYLTPAVIARFMAERSPYLKPHMLVLDPGCGTGILSAAVCEAAGNSESVETLHIDSYETDPLLAVLTTLVLGYSRDWLSRREKMLTYEVKEKDFVLENSTALNTESGTSGRKGSPGNSRYDLVISNPPYFKIGKDDPRAVAWGSVVHGQPNIYALFMAVSAEILSESGRLVYIVPRSFASGPYFRKFREVFFRSVAPTDIHLFESRKDVFRNQTVLQESVIIAARRRSGGEICEADRVLVSHSKGADDLDDRTHLKVGMNSVLDPGSANSELSIPVCREDLDLVQAVRTWPNTLHSLGLEISTGPVVPFRATRFLSHAGNGDDSAPLLWMQHVRPMRTNWPLDSAEKPQWIKVVCDSMKLLVEDATYVLLRRFTAKEEKRRLVAAPLARGLLGADLVGLENHLNYVWGVSRELDAELAYGLSALLNSSFLDRYFRISNGNTQVSATELRAMPLPDEGAIRSVGIEVLASLELGSDIPDLDTLVAEEFHLPSVLGIGPEPVPR